MRALIAATAFEATVAAGQDLQKARVAEWKPVVAKFQKPSALRAAWQLTNSVALYVLLWFLMYLEPENLAPLNAVANHSVRSGCRACVHHYA